MVIMGKRSSFERIEKDFYRTIDPAAVHALIPHLQSSTRYCEPCVGDGHLIAELDTYGHRCFLAADVEKDARFTIYEGSFDLFITNPPWSRGLLHQIIINLSDQRPTWLLFDSDWCHTKQSTPFLGRLKKIVSVGRLRWIPDTKMSGKDNCAWYLFDKNNDQQTQFFGRV